MVNMNIMPWRVATIVLAALSLSTQARSHVSTEPDLDTTTCKDGLQGTHSHVPIDRLSQGASYDPNATIANHTDVQISMPVKAFFAHDEETGLDSTKTNATGLDFESFVPIKEILYVKLVNVRAHLMSGPEKVYVEFSHRGKRRGESLPFHNLLEASLVNLPLIANDEGMQEPVKCTIKRARSLLGDKILFTADVVLRDTDEVTGIVRDLKGRDTGARLKLGLFATDWVSATAVEGSNQESNMGMYFEGGVMALEHLARRLFIGGTEVLKKPVEEANPELETIQLLDGLIEYPKVDEFFPLIWEIGQLAPILGWLLPFSDPNSEPVLDRATMCNEIRTKNLQGAIIEPYEGRWIAPLSDASMSRVFFSSLGNFLVRKVTHEDNCNEGNPYVADMMYLAKLKYRDGFENLGCKVYFDHKADILRIEDHDGTSYHPGDELWEWAKLKARSASFVYISIEHLMWYHMNYANIPGMALRMFLQPDHPIRLAMTPHFYRTHSTCNQAEHLLVVEIYIIHRALPFHYEGGLEKMYIDLTNSFKFMAYPDELEQRGMKNNKFHIGASDGVDLHKVMMKYVSNLFDEIYPKEELLEADEDMKRMFAFISDKLRDVPPEFNMANLKMVWGEVLFRVTGAHTSVGNVGIYALDPFFSNFRMNKKAKGEVVGNREVISVISLISGITVPEQYPTISQDWSHVLHDSESKAYAQLKSDLIELGEVIDERNKARRFTSRDFHPDHVAISIFS